MSRVCLGLATVFVAFGCLLPMHVIHAAATDHESGWDYQLRVSADLNDLQAKLCFNDSQQPRALIMSANMAAELSALRVHRRDATSGRLRRQGRRVLLPETPVACVSYKLRLRMSSNDRWRSRLVPPTREIRTVALEDMLLRPNEGVTWPLTRLDFITPPGITVSAPGTEVTAATDRHRYVLHRRPTTWDGSISIGRIERASRAVAGAGIRIAIVGDVSRATKRKLMRWFNYGVAALVSLYDKFPVSDLQVLIYPLAATDDPVPWGEVKRGGGDALHLYVDATRTLDELKENWVLVHELSHLLHPYIDGADRWLSEGIASYYQNVLRARAGHLSAAVAWRKLDAGFERGRRQTSAQETLAHDTQALMRARRYMRVYWGGAAIALMADIELRARSNGAMSLDEVMAQLQSCCLPSTRQWAARELLQTMDRIAGFEVFMPLYTQYVEQPIFPVLDETYRRLGIMPAAGSLRFREDAGSLALRDAIMKPRSRH